MGAMGRGRRPRPIPAPNNYRFLQVRNADAGRSDAVAYEETAYYRRHQADPPARRPPARLENHPNPFNPRPRSVTVPGTLKLVSVSVTVYGLGPPGRHPVRGQLPGGSRSGMS
jgi:hypothetical protein